jgi:cytochrome c peroxidase
MGADLGEVVARLSARPDYVAAFDRVFGAGPIDADRIAKAIAAFERTLITPDAPFDRFLRGDATALSERQLRGMALFEEVGCIVCHAGPGFSRASLLAPEGGASGIRLFPSLPSDYEKTYRLTEDLGAAKGGRAGLWRVPSLRNVALTGPYFHNGSVATLTEAVKVMATVQAGRVVGDGRVETRIEWSPETGRITRRTPSPLSEAQVADLVAFLESLTGTIPNIVTGE